MNQGCKVSNCLGVTSAGRWNCQRLNKNVCCFLGENSFRKTKVIPPEDATMVCFQQDGGCCNSKVGLGSKITQLELKTWFLAWKNVKTLSHTTTTPGSKNSQKEVYNQTDNQSSVLCPPKVASLLVLGLV